MAKKVQFKSNSFKDLFYEVIDEKWLDNDTFVLVFQDMTDGDNDTYHLEVEYHKDEGKITYTRVYEHENIDGCRLITPNFKKQIEEYVLRKVGVLRENSLLDKRKIGVELMLDVPKDMTVGEFNQWIKDLVVEVKSPNADKVRLLEVTNVGYMK